MGACAAVSTTCVHPCGAITCILRQCVHNKYDYNEDDHSGFPFQLSGRRQMVHPWGGIQWSGFGLRVGGRGNGENVLSVGKRLWSKIILILNKNIREIMCGGLTQRGGGKYKEGGRGGGNHKADITFAYFRVVLLLSWLILDLKYFCLFRVLTQILS